MRILTLLLITLLCANSSFSQERIIKQHGITKVETQITNTRKPEKSFKLVQTYGKKGKLLEEIKTNYKGEIVEHNKYWYDNYKKTVIKYDNLGNEIAKEVTIKNKDGKTIETSSENYLKKLKSGRKYTYDKWGKLRSEIWLNNIGEIERTKNYEYNDEGLLIKQTSLDETNSVIFEKEIHYED